MEQPHPRQDTRKKLLYDYPRISEDYKDKGNLGHIELIFHNTQRP